MVQGVARVRYNLETKPAPSQPLQDKKKYTVMQSWPQPQGGPSEIQDLSVVSQQRPARDGWSGLREYWAF